LVAHNYRRGVIYIAEYRLGLSLTYGMISKTWY
jgi:hypothetical protein